MDYPPDCGPIYSDLCPGSSDSHRNPSSNIHFSGGRNPVSNYAYHGESHQINSQSFNNTNHGGKLF